MKNFTSRVILFVWVALCLPSALASCSTAGLKGAKLDPSPVEHGTWSIAAIDFETGEIGIAGASCTHNVQGIAEVIPGVGAVVVQGMSNDDARELGMKLLASGAAPSEIVDQMKDPKFDPENQQYAVLSSNRELESAAYTGKLTDGWHGSAAQAGVTVQGNSLVSQAVVENTLAAFQNADGSVAEKLVRGLEAGAAAGGDKRCGDQRARSAFVTVYKADDPQSTPFFHLVVYGTEKGGEPAVTRLAEEFDSLYPRSHDRQSTRLYIIPTRLKPKSKGESEKE
jgi:Family of unknown function (DUF1028)